MNRITTYTTRLAKVEDKKRSLVEMVYIFLICAMIGWVVEVCFVYATFGRFSDRGMLFGPFCSIYGFGAIILYLLFYNLKPSKVNIPYAFFTSAVFMGTFELLSGLLLKYVFNIEMWNYRGSFLVILDYTTVPILIGWGILGTCYIFFMQPFILKIISFVPQNITKRLALFIVVGYFINFAFSSFNIYINPEVLYNLVNP